MSCVGEESAWHDHLFVDCNYAQKVWREAGLQDFIEQLILDQVYSVAKLMPGKFRVVRLFHGSSNWGCGSGS